MRLRILFISFIIFFSISQNAISQIKIGLRTGINASYLVEDISNGENINENFRFKPSISIAAAAAYKLSQNFFINSDLGYSDKGAGFDATDNGGKGNLSLNYLSFNLYPEFFLKNNIGFLTGIEIAYMLSAISRYDDTKVNISNIWDNKFDLSLIGGIVYRFDQKLKVDLRGIYGLLYPLKEEYNTTPDGQQTENFTLSYKNLLIQLNLRYLIEL